MKANMSTPAYEWEAMPELGAAHEWEDEYEFEDEMPFLGGLIGAEALHEAAHAALEAEEEMEGELEGAGEGEWEDELNPVRKVYPDATMEHLAHAAINAESEWEAGRAVRHVVPMAVKRVVPVAARAMPGRVTGVP